MGSRRDCVDLTSTPVTGLAQEIQLDAREMVRRAEYALGKAIRQGQAEGLIETPQEASRRATLTREVNQGRAPIAFA